MQSSLRIIVTGLITQHPLLGGITWHYLQYMLGLARLGYDVYYFEDSGEFPYNLDGGASGTDWIARDCTYNVGYLARIMARFGFEDRWAYHFPLKSTWFGLSDKQREAIIQSADLLINVSGSLEHPKNYRPIPHLLYIDTDPIITQIKLALGEVLFLERVEAHDTHFSFGESLSNSLPALLSKGAGEYPGGHLRQGSKGDTTRNISPLPPRPPAPLLRWRPTRQPIVLSEWRPGRPQRESFTTVMNWTSYEPLVYAGRTYGQKDVEFNRFLELPGQVAPTAMEVALSRTQYLKWQAEERDQNSPLWGARGGRGSDRAGWRVIDAIEACGDLDSYRNYIESSKAEWSVAKNAYVLGRPGWFSERSACYLAAGRPVVVQDTGFAGVLPVGEGILSFRTLPEAVAAIQEVEANYARHAQAARAIAETYFDADKVLTRLIDQAMSANDSANQRVSASAGQARVEGQGKKKQGSRGAGGQGRDFFFTPAPLPPRAPAPLHSCTEHPAVKAWAELGPGRVEPERIEALKEKKKGAVYRLAGVGPGNSAVIAKRCRYERAVIERAVYEEVLPHLPLPMPDYYGCVVEDPVNVFRIAYSVAGVNMEYGIRNTEYTIRNADREEEDSRFWWLFLEDVGDERYSPYMKEHCALAAQWLGAMHTGADGLRVRASLPNRGPAHYLMYLQSARQAIPQIRAIPSLKATEQTILQNIVAMCEYLEANWGQVETFCERMPRTFIHGDCLAKNVHVRTTRARLTIAPFDWGGAGWGLPATDLGQLGLPYRDLPPTQPDCATYWSVVREQWPSLDLQTIRQLANLGQMFWALKVISRGVPEFDYPGAHLESIINKFSVYKSVLANTIRSARWED
jgi:hypothetical protein